MGAPRVLIADDSPLVLRMIEKIATEAGFLALTAKDGLEAVETALTEPLDLVILDVMMPRMNGYQVCRLLKSDQQTSGIPIIICTVRSLDSEKLYAYTSGADHYLTKPFDPPELVRLVRTILASRQDPQPRRSARTSAARHPTSTWMACGRAPPAQKRPEARGKVAIVSLSDGQEE